MKEITKSKKGFRKQRWALISIFLLAVTIVPANVNAETHKTLYLTCNHNQYGVHFAWLGQIDHKNILYDVEYLPDIAQWLAANDYDLVIIEDVGTFHYSSYGSWHEIAHKTIGAIADYVKDTGKSLLILFGDGCDYISYLSGFGATPTSHSNIDPEAETSLIVDHEVTAGIWKIYIGCDFTLSIHEGFLTPLAYAPEEWWGVSDLPVAGAVRTYGNGKIAFASPNDLIDFSEKADNNRLIINIVNWLRGEPIGPEELPVELRNLQGEIDRLNAEIYTLDTKMKGLQEEISQLQQQKEEVIGNLPVVKDLEQQIDDLNSTYISLKVDYDSLKADYSDLESKYDELTVNLRSTWNLNCLFLTTTIIFIATTIIIAVRKPKIKP